MDDIKPLEGQGTILQLGPDHHFQEPSTYPAAGFPPSSSPRPASQDMHSSVLSALTILSAKIFTFCYGCPKTRDYSQKLLRKYSWQWTNKHQRQNISSWQEKLSSDGQVIYPKPCCWQWQSQHKKPKLSYSPKLLHIAWTSHSLD